MTGKLDLRINETTELEIFGVKNPPKRVTGPEAARTSSSGFLAEDLDGMIAELEQMGIEVEPVRVDEFTGKRMTFFADPDGLPLELHE